MNRGVPGAPPPTGPEAGAVRERHGARRACAHKTDEGDR
ncbi:hypothetical protein SUDANB126_01731 [Streptomyces sp. enrichment culture]